MQTTTVESTDRDSVDPLAEEIRALGTAAETASEHMEEHRQLPPELYERAVELQLFRQLVPKILEGRGDTPLRWFRRGVELSRFEPSLGWVVSQGAAEMGWIAAGGDEAWARHLLADPLSTSASTIAGLGALRVEDNRATLSGSWGFNTGCRHATWLGGLAIVEGMDVAGDGLSLRMCWVPSDRAEIMDDWDPTGMRGTGSHSVVIPEQEVATAWTIDLSSRSTKDLGSHRCLVGNGNWPIAGSVASTQLGNARRALDECRRLIRTKAPAPDFRPLAENSAVQRRLIELEGSWMAAFSSVERELDSMWEEAMLRAELSTESRWRLAAANIAANRMAVDVVNGACELTGTSVASMKGLMGRCLRDAHTLAGHIATGGTSQERAAQVSCGILEPDFMV